MGDKPMKLSKRDPPLQEHVSQETPTDKEARWGDELLLADPSFKYSIKCLSPEAGEIGM